MNAVTKALGQWRWRAVTAGLLVVGVGGTAAAAATTATSTSSEYRTAVVATGDVTQTLETSGNIASASRTDSTFQVGGTVASVEVSPGDVVQAGQVLATLDTSDLDDAVERAEEALTAAQETLADDLEAQTEGESTSSSTSSGTSSTASVTSGSSSSQSNGTASSGSQGGAPANAAVTQAQQVLLTAYDAAVVALQSAKDANQTATDACLLWTTAVAEAQADPQSADATAQTALLAACQDATAIALDAQADSAAAQEVLVDAAGALDEAVQDYVTAASQTNQSSGSSQSSSTSQSSSSSQSSSTSQSQAAASALAGAVGGESASSSSSVPSAADILADKAAVAQAEAELAVAQKQVEYATLTAPTAGTVVAVAMTAGDEVSASDTSTAVTIISDNSYVIELSVGLSDARLLEAGQSATVTLNSDGTTVAGTVASVSTVNSGNAYSPAYAVTIAIPDPGFEIRLGTATTSTITVNNASDVIVVPTSAITGAAGEATVSVLGDDGFASTVSVVIGALGSELTQIVSGLEVGQEVVLADLNLEITSEDESDSSGLLGGLSDTESEQEFTPPSGGFGNFPGGGTPPGS